MPSDDPINLEINTYDDQPVETGGSVRGSGHSRHIFIDDDLAPDRTAAERLYGDVSQHIKDLDLDAALDRIVETDAEQMGMDRDTAGDDIRRMMAYLQLDEADGVEFVNILGNGLADSDRSGWAKESRRRLSRAYGSAAIDRLQAAEDAVNRNPSLSAFVWKYKLGDHPDLVELLAKKAPDINHRYGGK